MKIKIRGGIENENNKCILTNQNKNIAMRCDAYLIVLISFQCIEAFHCEMSERALYSKMFVISRILINFTFLNL